MNAADGYWWYITINTSAGCEDNLLSLADISGSIGTELQEMPDGVSRLRMYYKSTRNGASGNAGRRFEAAHVL